MLSLLRRDSLFREFVIRGSTVLWPDNYDVLGVVWQIKLNREQNDSYLKDAFPFKERGVLTIPLMRFMPQ